MRKEVEGEKKREVEPDFHSTFESGFPKKKKKKKTGKFRETEKEK